jgi:glutamate dehydrogenase
MTDAVGERVLRGSYSQTQALSLARYQAPSMLDVHDRFMRDLEASGRLDRVIEMLPDAELIAERRQAGLGLTQPELAVVMAYSKITLYASLLQSDLPDDPALQSELTGYFPPPLPERFGAEMGRHRLRREIVATRVANDIVDRAGTTYVFRLREDTGATHADIARASLIARDVFAMASLWADIEALDGQVAAETQIEMMLAGRRMVERSARWLLRTRPRPLDITAEVERFAAGAGVVAGLLPDVLVESEQDAWRERVGQLVEAGAPEALAGRVAAQGALFSALDIAAVAESSGHPVEEVAALHFRLGGNLYLHWLRDQIALLARDTRWATMARAALRDDLFSLHAELTTDVLRYGGIDAWLEANRQAADRAAEILGEIRSGGTFDLTTLPVALREVRNLIGRAG